MASVRHPRKTTDITTYNYSLTCSSDPKNITQELETVIAKSYSSCSTARTSGILQLPVSERARQSWKQSPRRIGSAFSTSKGPKVQHMLGCYCNSVHLSDYDDDYYHDVTTTPLPTCRPTVLCFLAIFSNSRGFGCVKLGKQ